MQAWPACALGTWAAAWLGGRCSPDDVADTLAGLGGAVAGDAASGSVLDVLALLRGARTLSVRLPGPGDPQGLPPGVATTAALHAGEVLLVGDGVAGSAPRALIPGRPAAPDMDTGRGGPGVHWSVYDYAVPVPDAGVPAAGDVEYELRQAVSDIAAMIDRLGSRTDVPPRELRAAVRTETARHQLDLPPHDDPRATRLIETAAQVEAIVTVAGGATFGSSAGHWQAGDTELRRLARLARTARASAVNRVISEYLPAAR